MAKDIGFDKRDYREFELEEVEEEVEEDNETEEKSRKNRQINNLCVDIYDIISNCRKKMYIPLFDESDFGCQSIKFYLKSLEIP